jgi:hypothetical protein
LFGKSPPPLQFPSSLFAECATEISNLMAADSFKRFKQGDLFQEFMKASHAYESVEQHTVAKRPSLKPEH